MFSRYRKVTKKDTDSIHTLSLLNETKMLRSLNKFKYLQLATFVAQSCMTAKPIHTCLKERMVTVTFSCELHATEH